MSVVGFDLDMTLVDSRQGITECMQYTVRHFGGEASAEQLWPTIGNPLKANLALFLPSEVIDDAARVYRSNYERIGVPVSTAMPGARELVTGLRSAGHQVVVVSAKVIANVADTLAHLGISVDHIYGDVFAADKATPLREAGATAYIGDHPGDMIAARTADATAIGVVTGPEGEAALWAAGADLVIPTLVGLPPDPAGWRNGFDAAAPTR